MSGAADQFRRLLAVLPRFATAPEQSISGLARELGIPAAQLVTDLAALAERSDESAEYDDGVSVVIEGDTVMVRTDHFHRPMRLTAAELCAIELGLGVLAHELPPAASARIGSVLQKLRTVISDLPRDAAYRGLRDGAFGTESGGGVLGSLRDALRKGRAVAIRYHAPNQAEATPRVVRPYALIFSNGSWYLIGWCERSEGQRLFRADRIVEVVVTETSAKVPSDFRLEDVMVDGHLFVTATPPPRLVVRYSAAIARWIAERDGGPVEADGSVLRSLPLADRGWAIRHVLGYGPDATIVEPAELRREVAERLRAMVA